MVGSKVFNKEKSRVWTGLRPVSPDGITLFFFKYNFLKLKL